jgi:hypothetical protein
VTKKDYQAIARAMYSAKPKQAENSAGVLEGYYDERGFRRGDVLGAQLSAASTCAGPTGVCHHPDGVGHGGDHVPVNQARLDSLADAETARLFALTRPHDGSQLDEDMEGLLLDARAAYRVACRA